MKIMQRSQRLHITYNSDGTIASQTVTPSVGAQVTTVYSYTYNPDGSYRLTSTVNNVSDTDGNNSSVTTVQNYDWLGNLVSATDPNGILSHISMTVWGV
mgnify:CR=1 FL=1